MRCYSRWVQSYSNQVTLQTLVPLYVCLLSNDGFNDINILGTCNKGIALSLKVTVFDSLQSKGLSPRASVSRVYEWLLRRKTYRTRCVLQRYRHVTQRNCHASVNRRDVPCLRCLLPFRGNAALYRAG